MTKNQSTNESELKRLPHLGRIVVLWCAVLFLAACSSSDSPVAVTDPAEADESPDPTVPVDQSPGLTPPAAPTTGEPTPPLDNPEPEVPDSESPVIAPPEIGPPPMPGETSNVRYRLTFEAVWSAESHPLNFPGNPHFSGLIGAVHNEQVRFWEPGQIASNGIQQVAETGGKSTFGDEISAAIRDGLALATIDGAGIALSPGETSIEFEVNSKYPQISIVSMLAPSPDWFVGLHNFSLFKNGEFIQSETVELVLYDSGSDSGVNYTSANTETNPLSPIQTLTSDPVNAPFVNGGPVVGFMSVERLP